MRGSGEERSGLRGSLGPAGAGAGNTEVAKVGGELAGVRRRRRPRRTSMSTFGLWMLRTFIPREVGARRDEI